jgi:SAM-dependent methyltransferase
MNIPTEIEYSHEINRELHTVDGALKALSILFASPPATVLDVGCGTGTWLSAALSLGATKVRGVEGLDLADEMLFVPKALIEKRDLNQFVDIGERFDLVICLEAAEHIEPENADTLVDTLTHHGDLILFSAAAPRQGGTHHVNCQWPEYWQDKFNARGYACDDAPRWTIWNESAIEPWYRQNMLWARKDPAKAGTEPRIIPVIHPDALDCFSASFLPDHQRLIETGGLPWRWYLSAPLKASRAKLRQKLGLSNGG